MKEQCFLVEGAKSVLELFDSDFQTNLIIGTAGFYQDYTINKKKYDGLCLLASETELAKTGTFSSNRDALAVVKIPKGPTQINERADYILALDDINNPGNLGTIIRVADWYGIHQILLSFDCADQYNPKVINSSMGSFTRVKISRLNLHEYLKETSIPVIGTYMKGKSLHEFKFPKKVIILIGNESHGINRSFDDQVDYKVSIPRFGKAESLNAAIATAIICDNLRN